MANRKTDNAESGEQDSTFVDGQTEPNATVPFHMGVNAELMGMELFESLQAAGFVNFHSGRACVMFAKVADTDTEEGFGDGGYEIVTVPALHLAKMSEAAIKKLVAASDPAKEKKAGLRKLLKTANDMTEEELLTLFRALKAEG